MTRDILVGAWAAELGTEPDPDENFFASGGNSLMAAKIVAKARKAGIMLSLADFLAAPTVNGLLTRLGEPVSPARFLTTVQSAMLRAVREALSAPGLTMSADLRELGPWQVTSERLRGVLRDRFSFDVSVSDATTVSALCLLLRGSATSDTSRCLVPLREGTDGVAFYFVHPLAGSVARYSTVSQRLSPEHRVYGLQAIGLTPGGAPDDSIIGMARRYVDEVVENGDIERTVFAGYSFGATVALEAARILRAEHPGRHSVAFIDGEAVGPSVDPRWAAFNTLSRNALGVGELPGGILDLPEAEALEVLRQRAVEAGVVPVGFPIERLERIVATACATQAAHNTFRHDFFDGDIHMFVSADGRDGLDYWARHATKVHVTWVEGNHFSIMEDSAADILATGFDALAKE
jgi:thioesterase domain-containing protein